jgi:DNA-binding NarL/FixJ family response regulator
MKVETLDSNSLRGSGCPRVLITSDIRLYRSGLSIVLQNDGRLNVLASCEDVTSAHTIISEDRIDAVLLDSGMTGALDFVGDAKRIHKNLVIIALGLAETVEEVLPYAESGIDGYVSREGAVEDVVRAVISALHGELICSRTIAAALQRRVARLALRQTASSLFPASQLTRREEQVVKSLRLGMTNKQIASSLHISVSTVKNHVHNVLEKLGCRTRLEVAARLRDQGSRP